MTESFLQARGLKVASTPHAGPASAARLVENYGCHVHPLRYGTKIPATAGGLKDAVLDASAITGNYGVACGRSGILAVDLDDYVEDNQIQAFLDTFELPPTFTITTGSGGRSMWFRAPEGVDLTQKLDFVRGVDIKAGESYVLGPGCKLHPDYIKTGATGDGNYAFVKDSPKLFAPAPQNLVDALLELKRPTRAEIDIDHGTYDELDDSTRFRVDAYVRRAVEADLAKLDGLKRLEERESNEDDYRWESGTVAYTAKIGSLVAADWTGLDYDNIRELVEAALPHDDKHTLGHGLSLFSRAVYGDRIDPRPMPEELLEPDPMEATFAHAHELNPHRPFRDAAGSEEPPAATVVEVDDNPDDWPEEPWNEKGDVERTKRWAKDGLHWLADEEIWVRWAPEEHRWVKDPKAGAKACQRGMSAAEHTEILNYSDEPKLDKEGQPEPGSSQRDKFITHLRNRWGIGQFERVAKSLALSGDVDAESSEFDADGMLLAVKDGVVDLRTGKFIDGAPELKITVGSKVVFDPAAEAPLFQKYLETSMPDPAMREYLQTIMGYSMIGGNPEGAFFIHWGPQTNNGKSVLLNVVRAIMGSQIRAASSKALVKSKNEQHSVEIADLAGPRLLQMGETAEGAQIEEQVIKQITGKDVIAARKLNQSNRDWLIDGKVHILTNYLPHISASPSMKRRLHLVLWPVEVAGDKIVQDLDDLIIQREISGVLNWLIEGCLRWQRQREETPEAGERKTGLIRPAQAVMDMDRYFHEEDQLAEWMDERTVPGEEAKSSALYEDYRTWCFPKGIKPMSSTAFGRKLREKKIARIEKRDANYYALGLKAGGGIDSYFS